MGQKEKEKGREERKKEEKERKRERKEGKRKRRKRKRKRRKEKGRGRRKKEGKTNTVAARPLKRSRIGVFFFFFLIMIRYILSGEIPFQGRETPYKGGGVIRHLDHV